MKTKNIAIALFDPQLDHLSMSPTKTEIEKWRPATAFLSLHGIPLITHYMLITPTIHEKVALRLKPLIENHIHNIIHSRIKDEDIANSFVCELEIQIVPIEYTDIWNIDACVKCLNPVLNGIVANERRQPITTTISLLGSTTAARTALYLATKHLERTNENMRFRYVKRIDPRQAKTPENLWYGTDISLTSNGLLRQGIGTSHPEYSTALDKLERVIQTFQDAKILITGPTGAGKSELGRLIISYMQALHGDMNNMNCIVQNVAAIAPNLIETELFGHEKGAFTDAHQQHIGIFERANNGILFLDEIGELPLHLQVKLLTILDGNPFTRVGGTEHITTRFLLLCGTNKDLRKECAAGRFRLDLFERINTWHVDVPPLKDRPDDIERALQRELGEWETAHKSKVNFADGAREVFLDRAKQCVWDGNFREFHATFLHLALFSEKGGITEQAIEEEFNRRTSYEIDAMPLAAKSPQDNSDTSESIYDLAEMARLACALDVCRKCKTAKEAGEILFAARSAAARQKGTGFNGATSLQRVFATFGLEAHFKNGIFMVSPLTQ